MLLRWRWSAAVVMEWLGTSLCAVMATAELRELGGCCWRCETTKEERGKRNEGVAGGCWRVEGARLPGLATLGRAPATRGQPRVHAVAKT